MEDILQIISYIAAILSGIVFWAGFLILGLITRRYSVVFKKNTMHMLLMLAPSGILIYSILLILRASFAASAQAWGTAIQGSAYFFFVLSSFLCFAALFRFNRILKELLSYGENEAGAEKNEN
ncbi:MAG TPA: hypothetical protein ENN55_06025 [Firmicutes bacterium]|nr:hypothetical protein [Bacillota bacterium]